MWSDQIANLNPSPKPDPPYLISSYLLPVWSFVTLLQTLTWNVTRQALAKCSVYKRFVQMSLISRQNSTDSSNVTLWRKKPREYTNVLLGLCSLTTGVVFSFQSSMTFIDKQQWIQNARINQNLLYISTQCALTGEVIRDQKQENKMQLIVNLSHGSSMQYAKRQIVKADL